MHSFPVLDTVKGKFALIIRNEFPPSNIMELICIGDTMILFYLNHFCQRPGSKLGSGLSMKDYKSV